MDRTSRRRFLTASLALGSLGVLAGCTRRPASAPQARRVARIGFLKQPPLDYVEVFREGMRELGYVEGRDFVLEYRYVERVDELRAYALELVQLPVDVIVAPNAAAVEAARAATTTIPIVMVNMPHPIAAGVIASLNRPGGNVTGTSLLTREGDITGKRLQLLQQVSPVIARVAVFWNPTNDTAAAQWRETQDAAQDMGLQLLSLAVQQPQDFPAAFAAATEHGADALFLPISQVVMAQLPQIAAFAQAQRLPSMAFQREYVDVGGLLSYGASIPDLYRRAAYYVDKLLKGADAAEVPVEQPTRWDLVINLKTARALALTIPSSVLAQAADVVQ